MAEFLTTTGVSYRLEQIIKDATERLVLISPFLRVNARLRELLEDKDRLKLDVRVIYGKNQLQPEENNWLESMTSIRTSYCENLHAKCYLNEKEALLTSMNLYEFSQVHNNEMGVLISRADEPHLYEDVWKEAQRIVRVSDEIRVTVARVEAAGDNKEDSFSKEARAQRHSEPDRPKRGFCIRCKDVISANPTQPYCSRCFRSWNRFKNEGYGEKYCHLCGSDHEATMSKPVCLACYRKYRTMLEFAAG